MANYTATVNSRNQIFVKKQASVLSKSLLVAGVAFIVMFAFSLSLYALLTKYIVMGKNDSALSAIYMISILCILAVMIMSIVTMKGINKMKLSTIITMIVLYGVGNGMAFGVLFYAIEQSQSTVNMIDIMTCFLLTGLIFGICGAIGTVLSVKFTMSLGKFLMIATFAFLGIYLILIIMSLFTSGIFGNGRTNILIWGIWGFLIILYIMYDFSVIKKSQPFIEMLDAQTQTKYVYLFGFMLFMNLIQLLWVLIRIMLSVRR